MNVLQFLLLSLAKLIPLISLQQSDNNEMIARDEISNRKRDPLGQWSVGLMISHIDSCVYIYMYM